MLDSPVIPLLLTLLGIAQLAGGYYSTRRIVRELPARRRSWRLLSILILLFAIGYSVFAGYLLVGGAGALAFGVSVVFAAGGSFVFITARLACESIGEARSIARLETENSRISDDKRRLASILDTAAEGILTFDAAGHVESANRAAGVLFGCPLATLYAASILDLLEPVAARDPVNAASFALSPLATLPERVDLNGGEEQEMRGISADGSTLSLSVRLSRIQLDGRQLFTAIIGDMGERKRMLEKLRHLAEHDAATDLHNRYFLHERLTHELSQCSPDRPLALIALDLDNFKTVNDVLGHAAGDALLVEVANTLRERTPAGATIARLGGDEFTVLLPHTDAIEAERIGEAFRAAFDGYRFRRGMRDVDIGCSVGVSLTVDSLLPGDRLMAQADLACHMAKRAGRNTVRSFHPGKDEALDSPQLDAGWSERIQHALENDLFVLAAQPIHRIDDVSIACHELLIRLRDSHGDLIMSNAFLPVAERLGLATRIDAWVIDAATDLLAAQLGANPAARFAINLSTHSLADGDTLEHIRSAIERNRFEPSALTFGITEAAAMEDLTSTRQLFEQLHLLGCRTGLYNFGGELCSLTGLRELPADIIKLDGRFIRALTTSDIDWSIVCAMNDVVHAHGMQSIAEHIEDEATLAALKAMGIDFGQGRHLGAPELMLEPERQAACRA